MPGPSALIRENCPLATPDNDGLMSAAQAAQLEGEQSLTFSFDGTQDYLEAVWPIVYPAFVLSSTVSAAGGAIVPVNFTKFGDGNAIVDNTGVRVVPTVPFTGVVYVTIRKV